MVIHGSDLPPGVLALRHLDGHQQRLIDRGYGARWECDCTEYRNTNRCRHTARCSAQKSKRGSIIISGMTNPVAAKIGGKLRLVITLTACTALIGCAYTVFAPPKVLYSATDSIGVKYRSAGIQSINQAGKAMKLVSSHCDGKFTVTNRTIADGWTTVDAHCD